MLNTEYSDLDSGSGSGSGSEYIEIDYDIFNTLKIHPIIYFIFSVIGFAILVCLFHICSEESRLKKNRNRGESDNQSWADFVREMEGHQDALAFNFVQSQNKEKIKTENSKRINKTIENENHLNFNIEKDKDKYYSFNFNTDNTECSICHEKIIEPTTDPVNKIKYNDTLYMFNCGHTIHNKCYKDYKMSIIVTNDTVFKCPLCRN